jgi:hypothetical protein
LEVERLIMLAHVIFSSSLMSAHGGSGVLVWLGIALAVLVLGAGAAFFWLRAGGTRDDAAGRAAHAALPMTCPACHRSYPTGTVFCPVDACRLLSQGEGASSERGVSGGKCPRCRRVYDAGTRYCAVDAEELVPLPLWQQTHAEGGVHVDADDGGRRAPVHFHGDGKICPVCAAKYDLEAVFCGRDGSELVTVN